jgi:hypothetical protein
MGSDGQRKLAGWTILSGVVVLSLVASSPLFAQEPAGAQSSPEVSVLQDLAERLFARPSANPFDQAPEEERARLVLGELPPALEIPIDPPLDARVVGAVVYEAVAGPTGGVVLLEAAAAPSEVEQAFAAALAEHGWAPPPPLEREAIDVPGFVPSRQRVPGGSVIQVGSAPAELYCQPGGSRELRVHATPGRTEGSEIRVSVELAPRGSLRVTDCVISRSTAFRPPSLLPRLTPPMEAIIGLASYRGGVNAEGVEAVAITDWTAGQLAAHYQAQLAEAGWESPGEGSDRATAWSTWRLPTEDPLEGWLQIAAWPGTDERRLHLTVRPPTAPILPDWALPESIRRGLLNRRPHTMSRSWLAYCSVDVVPPGQAARSAPRLGQPV